jgi:cytidine deaminase
LKPSAEQWAALSSGAWAARENARVLGRTRVGAAALSSEGGLFSGCNVEHHFRSHDVHAEVNALGSMIASGETKAVASLVASERARLTPCGACLDWIFELGGPDCRVAFEKAPDAIAVTHRADELMPFYPQ